MLLRLLCFLAGHRHVVIAINLRRHLALAHLHSAAGTDAVCVRCGSYWRDAIKSYPHDHIQEVP